MPMLTLFIAMARFPQSRWRGYGTNRRPLDHQIHAAIGREDAALRKAPQAGAAARLLPAAGSLLQPGRSDRVGGVGMKVLVVGAGGREHALCWGLAASPLVSELYCAPGSDAIAKEATCVPLAIDDVAGIVAFCRDQGIELVVPGPELPP